MNTGENREKQFSYRIYSNKRPGRRHLFLRFHANFSDFMLNFSDFTLNFSDFTLKTPIFNKMCLFDDEKVHFEHKKIAKQF